MSFLQLFRGWTGDLRDKYAGLLLRRALRYAFRREHRPQLPHPLPIYGLFMLLQYDLIAVLWSY